MKNIDKVIIMSHGDPFPLSNSTPSKTDTENKHHSPKLCGIRLKVISDIKKENPCCFEVVTHYERINLHQRFNRKPSR